MSFVQTMTGFGETVPLPDVVTRAAIKLLVGRTQRQLSRAENDADRRFARDMAPFPIALNTAEANAQHYEIPAAFFDLVLGPQRKYSSCLYDDGIDTLAAAEERALQVSAEHAALADGQRILELGCGWGSLSLWMARHYPAARITAVSNSHSQREFIAGKAKAEGFGNLTVITADMNGFQPQDHCNDRFDRVVSVEMFEHMANWRPLLQRLRDCLEPDGRMFMHVFANRHASYRFAADDKEDWIAQHYFTGGIMPSRNLIRQFPDCFAVDARMVVERPPLSAHGATLAGEFRPQRRRGARSPQARLRPRRKTVAAALAVVFPGDHGTVRPRSRRGMGRQPLPADAGALTKSSARDQAHREKRDRGGDAGGERAVGDIDHGDLQRPIA